MGISRYVFVAVLACCAIGGLQAANEAPRHQKKLYINEQTITVTKEGIEVNTKEGIIKVKTLRSDRKGVFVTAQDVCKGDGRYYCRGCGLTFRNYSEFTTHYSGVWTK